MGLLEELRDGGLGVEIVFPRESEPTKVEGESVWFAGPRPEVAWWVCHFPGATLDLSDGGWPTLKRDIERQTRALFDQMFASRERSPESGAAGPRTSDPTWSPLIEIERSPVDGGWSLYVLHRMTYEPGSEVLMGHLLVPSGGGLTETRWITSERSATGAREAVCLLKAGIGAGLTQAVFDDPALDAQFPDHPLSVAREAHRWLASQVRIRVLRPAWSDTRAAVDLPDIGYAVVPPPRFSLQSIEPGPRGRPYASMSRVSFSGTDGLDSFMVHSLPAPLRVRWSSSSRTLTEEMRRLAREIYEEGGVRNVRDQVIAADAVDIRPTATVLVEGDGHLGPLRMVASGIARDRHIVALFLSTSATLPAEEMAAEVAASAQTLKSIRR